MRGKLVLLLKLLTMEWGPTVRHMSGSHELLPLGRVRWRSP